MSQMAQYCKLSVFIVLILTRSKNNYFLCTLFLLYFILEQQRLGATWA